MCCMASTPRRSDNKNTPAHGARWTYPRASEVHVPESHPRVPRAHPVVLRLSHHGQHDAPVAEVDAAHQPEDIPARPALARFPPALVRRWKKPVLGDRKVRTLKEILVEGLGRFISVLSWGALAFAPLQIDMEPCRRFSKSHGFGPRPSPVMKM